NPAGARPGDAAAASSWAAAHYNAYRAALREGNWDDALGALKDAATLDPLRFAPFPLERYVPVRILALGASGGNGLNCSAANLLRSSFDTGTGQGTSACSSSRSAILSS